MRRWIALLSLAWLAAVAQAAPPAAVPVPVPVEIVSAEFGLFDDSVAGELGFEPASVIPRIAGQRYGWVIGVRTAARTLAVREEYLLPSGAPAGTPPAGADELNISVPRRRQVSQRQLVPVEGKIYGLWTVGPNEPAGPRQLEVIIEGRPGASFAYDMR